MCGEQTQPIGGTPTVKCSSRATAWYALTPLTGFGKYSVLTGVPARVFDLLEQIVEHLTGHRPWAALLGPAGLRPTGTTG